MARKGPPVTVPGLGSQLSNWESPPARLMTIIRFCWLDISAANEGEVKKSSPGMAAAPAPASEVKKRRRLRTCSAVLQE